MTHMTPTFPRILRNLTLSTAFLAFGQVACAQQSPLPEDKGTSNSAETASTDASEVLQTPMVEFAMTEAPDDHVIGSNLAPITVIMYASVTCSHCGSWFESEWDAVKKDLIESDKIRFILRPIPTQPQEMSVLGFLLAECAPESAYFDTIEYQMKNQKKMIDLASQGKGKDAYAPVAALAGLEDENAIRACLQDPKMMEHLQLSGQRGTAAQIKGVPAFYVNGSPYNGKQDAHSLTELFNGMIESGVSQLPEVEPYNPHAGHGH
ncbi:protein-disulfide isomerase [Litorimonas taeanensis]|uniref:Protein-disulfide isomerase n=1 Tax=Litorimonas taeanensis TaxID=568099 RepID=A0A420WJ62_9PROT|nr:thioredoxin domain-containing protein [Litorimonas taeanensis]RKQ70976.1 protein-disulfide isomerase [Litorimonas taeanensis]